MMLAPTAQDRLLDRLPPVRGRYTVAMPLDRITWFGVGGPAEVSFRALDVDDLCAFLKAKPADVPVTVIGVGSNLLVRDGGIPGVVVRLGRGFTVIAIDGTRIEAGAASLDTNVALACRNAGVAGLEFLSGVPGTIGGALRMNAGAYRREMKDVVVHAEAVDSQGGRHRLAPRELGFTYRHAAVPADWIFTGCTLQGTNDDPLAIARRMAEIAASREATQPIRTRTGGSTFTNLPGRKAWELIDAAGCRGLTIGGAMVSEKHCNFLINTGTATAADIETLGEAVRARVLAKTGVALEWEIRRIGVPDGADQRKPA